MLKQSVDGLTKTWKPLRSNDPFNDGGKMEFVRDFSRCFSLFNGNVVAVEWSNLQCTPLLVESEDEKEDITCFCVNSSGTEIVTASKSLLLRHWTTADNTCVRSIKGHVMPVLTMTFDKSDSLVATGSADRTVRVWDIARGYCTHVFRYHTGIVQHVQFHPDPTKFQLFSCGDDNSIKVYDLINSSCKASFNEHLGSPTAIAFSSNGYLMASVGRDKVINFYELRKFTHIKTIAVMDEMESVIILTHQDAKSVLSNIYASRTQDKPKNERAIKDSIQYDDLTSFVLMASGEKGIFHFYKCFMNVS